MADAETIERLVREGYQKRQSGDKAALRDFFAPGATFRMAGHDGLSGRLPVTAVEALPIIDDLMDQFTFNNVEILKVITDGRNVAVQLRAEVSSGDGPRHTTEFCDIWELDADGRITSITEFLDTQLIAGVAEAAMA